MCPGTWNGKKKKKEKKRKKTRSKRHAFALPAMVVYKDGN